MPSFRNIFRYAYSNTRVKAMEAKLVKGPTMQEIARAKDVSSMLAVLFHTDYEKSIAEFGGMSIRTDLMDFALSKNFAERVSKLVSITPKKDRDLVRAVTAKWDLYNVKLVIQAKERGLKYDDIAGSVIDNRPFTAALVKEAMGKDSIDDALIMLVTWAPSAYARMLKDALRAYRKGRNAAEAIEQMDSDYYALLSKSVKQVEAVDAGAARILRMDIDMKNALTTLKAKRLGMEYKDFERTLIKGGTVKGRVTPHVYTSSGSVEELAPKLKAFDLKTAVALYEQDKRIIHLEVGMKNQMLRESVHLVRHSVLSFGAIVAYVYLKELEMATLRALLKGKQYGLNEAEMEELMAWKP